MCPKLLLFVLLIILSGTFTGCWDLTEVDRRAFATAVGIDPDPPNNIRLTVQIPLTQQMLPPGLTNGGQAGKTFNTIAMSSQTVQDAFNDLQTNTFQTLVIEQNKAVIIGEKGARHGVKPLLDGLLRNPKAPSQSTIMIAHGYTAAEILKFEPAQATLPGEEFVQAGLAAEKYNRTYFIPIWRFMLRIFHGSTDAYAPLISWDQKARVFVIAGVAVFHADRLTGELTGDEAECFGILANLMRAGRMVFFLPGRKETLRNIKANTVIKISNLDHRPFFKINVKLNGIHSESAGNYLPLNPNRIKTMEKEMARVLKPKLTALVKKLQQLNSDVINFCEELRVQEPELWKAVNWEKIYPAVLFSLEVKVEIENNGIIY